MHTCVYVLTILSPPSVSLGSLALGFLFPHAIRPPPPGCSHTRPETWEERLARQAQDARLNLHGWIVSQWMSSGAAAAVEESQMSIRGNLRHTMGRLAQRVGTLQQEGWDALERRIDPMPVNRRTGGRGGGAAQGDSDVNNVWEVKILKSEL